MSKFSAPADNLVSETRGYIDAQIDNVKLRTVKGLSQGTSAIASLLLIFIVANALVLALSFALALWLGEVLNSYAGAAFIVAGILLLLLVVFILLRKRLFKNSFVAMYADVLFRKESKPEGLNTQDSVDMAIWHAENRIKEKEQNVSESFAQAKEYYSPMHLLGEGLSYLSTLIPDILGFLFRKKVKKD